MRNIETHDHSSLPKKVEIAIVVGTLIVLAGIWAFNGYEDTWLYVMAGIIAVPASWFLSKKVK